ncbi:MAG: glutamine-hydrolyzing GMP synthase [Candidatus Nanopelagicales bacterium]
MGVEQTVLVIDFGAQYAQLIARRVREAGIYSELVPHTISKSELLAKNPAAIILSGGPSSVYQDKAPKIDKEIFESEIPTFGICYGFQAMAQALGGEVTNTREREFGSTIVNVEVKSKLFKDLAPSQEVWMSHGDAVTKAPEDFVVTATSSGAPVAAFESNMRPFAGVQFHPEVLHTANGQKILEKFLYEIAKLKPTWTVDNIVEDLVTSVKDQVGTSQVICGLSGGVDSAVAAALVQKAVGNQLTCIFIDHGLLRKGEREQVEKDFVNATNIKLVVKDESTRFLNALAGIKDPEEKRKIIGREFIRSFEDAASELVEKTDGEIKYLVQGTLYPDVVESGHGAGTATIKSHHNVGGLPEDLKFELVEPLRTLFKDEVRKVGRSLALPSEIVERHPFPGPGLAIRIVGEVTQENLKILQEADAIAREELTNSKLNQSIWQFPVVLLAEVRSVGVQGDGRTYGHPVVLRPVTSEDAMTADWARLPYELLAKISNRITNEIPEINRVTLDITSKPPGTIEWE